MTKLRKAEMYETLLKSSKAVQVPMNPFLQETERNPNSLHSPLVKQSAERDSYNAHEIPFSQSKMPREIEKLATVVWPAAWPSATSLAYC